ncbi:uncharacterized protein A4U43_C01F16360 [Asparagus officinalis]|uniref:Uncharacterized protein n=1 Tax=Asparagus officinalis TaxID=4686 RepID=A0A5P1FUE6_ASPOF|nr:uncharacterized protein A4U43_C01F16360 [Asparagus officinalis]
MGLTVSLLQKFGLPGMQSLSTDKLFDNFFGKEEIDSFEKFHIAFINLCSAFNEIMPGKHVKVPPLKEIEKWYQEWAAMKDGDEKMGKLKSKLEELLSSESKSKEDGAMVLAGMVAPTGGHGAEEDRGERAPAKEVQAQPHS